MKASDYIVEYFIEKGITDVFGYPGGMVTHLMDSLSKYRDKIKAHCTYHEQGAAFAACGFAQVSGKVGIAYATSGPGATNLITGICNAYMDSIPTLFITGQVNSFEQKGELKVRQRGFQETDIVSMVKSITKYAVSVNDANKLKWYMDKAFYISQEGRKGPVLLDIAMDVMRAEIQPSQQKSFCYEMTSNILNHEEKTKVDLCIKKAKRPVFLLGKGILLDDTLRNAMNTLGIPIVTSMIAVDMAGGLRNFYGFIGAYGNRAANFIIAKSDLVISLGARLDVRQVGAKRENFAPHADILRIDIDSTELEYKLHKKEFSVCADAHYVAEYICDLVRKERYEYSSWLTICNYIWKTLLNYDVLKANQMIEKISEELIPEQSVITTDVGQNQVWIAQSFKVKRGQRILFSGGHGAMGYSLPAAIGACIANRNPVYCFSGDGGFQMNMQELQFIVREHLPVKIFVFNNQSLGMIRHFQEMYFGGTYYQTKEEGGYSTPDFEKIAGAYDISYRRVEDMMSVFELKEILQNDEACLVELRLEEDTYVFPKLEYGKPNQDQEPLIDRTIYNELMELKEEDVMAMKDGKNLRNMSLQMNKIAEKESKMCE